MSKHYDDFDILTSVWILSCNDENPVISYEGIRYRLNLDKDYDLTGLVENRRELFRTSMPMVRFKLFKDKLKNNWTKYDWLKQYNEDKRKEIINNLSPQDLFRCQFRVKDNAEKAPLEIIDWGLKHIDTLRKAEIETSDYKSKKWTNIWIPLASLIVALSAVLSSVILQVKTQHSQIEMKKYEISFQPKRQNYSSFISNLFYAFESAKNINHVSLKNKLDQIEIAYYNIEPFLDQNLRNKVWEQFQQFSSMCYSYVKIPLNKRTDSLNSQYSDSFLGYKNFFIESLYPALFEDVSKVTAK